MYRGTIGRRLHGKVVDKPGSQPWSTSSWTPRGYPVSNVQISGDGVFHANVLWEDLGANAAIEEVTPVA